MPAGTLVAATIAGILSGIPSTLHALATGRDPVESPTTPTWRSPVWAITGLVVHAALSLGWAGAIRKVVVNRQRPVPARAAAGRDIAALDLAIARRWFPRVAALPPWSQVLDHVAFGPLVGVPVSPSGD